MTTVKVKLRPSTVDGRQSTIFYQVIHRRVVRQYKTGYYIYPDEWNKQISKVVLSNVRDDRINYLLKVDDEISADIRSFNRIISDMEHDSAVYTADDIISEFVSNKLKVNMFTFAESVISKMRMLGKIRTSETYASSLSSFKRFRGGRDLSLEDMDSDLIMHYEAYLKERGLTQNSSSFYMRNLRAIYNRAVEKGLTQQKTPFKHVYTGVDKTVKRGVPLKVVKRIREMDLSMNAALDFARDMFLFSFYTRGMSFIDMAFLHKKSLKGNMLTYRRRKTGQQLFIKWEKCMQEIVDKYDTSTSIYLLPIIYQNSSVDERKQYIYKAHNINRNLRIIARRLGLSSPLTMYVARHAWASIAKSKNVPISVISEGMGHDSEATTRIYLASLDTVVIDQANSLILQSFGK